MRQSTTLTFDFTFGSDAKFGVPGAKMADNLDEEYRTMQLAAILIDPFY